jgi:hypothetical protein
LRGEGKALVPLDDLPPVKIPDTVMAGLVPAISIPDALSGIEIPGTSRG